MQRVWASERERAPHNNFQSFLMVVIHTNTLRSLGPRVGVLIWLESLYHRALLSFIKRWSNRSTLFQRTYRIHIDSFFCLFSSLFSFTHFCFFYFIFIMLVWIFRFLLFFLWRATKKKTHLSSRSFILRWVQNVCVCVSAVARTEMFPRVDDKHESRSYGRLKWMMSTIEVKCAPINEWVDKGPGVCMQSHRNNERATRDKKKSKRVKKERKKGKRTTGCCALKI